MSRDREIVEDMKKVFRNMLSSPSIQEVSGTWYLFEKPLEEGLFPRIYLADKEGHLEGCGPHITVESMRKWGWKVTPVLIHKVISPR